jgi:Ca-activated chloride channel family protein
MIYSLGFALFAGCAAEQQADPSASRDDRQEQDRARELVIAVKPEDNRVIVELEPSSMIDALAGGEAGTHGRMDHSATPAGAAEEVRHERTKKLAMDGATFAQRNLPQNAALAAAQVQAHIRHPSERLYREQYNRPDDHRVIRVVENPVSTFSVDVDTGAYSNMRRWLNQGQLPPEDAVRVEEFINYFDYAYPGPESAATPFLVNTEIAPTPWNAGTHLLRIGIQGFDVPRQQLPASNLVFLVDVSGSMQSHDKLPLLKQALGMLTNELGANDCISLVVYAGASGVVLQPTPGTNKVAIHAALGQLEAGGSTNGAAGIRLAYQLARQNFRPGGVNRVILATDGDFNVGLASTEELIDLIQRQRAAGIALTTLGFGTGNYNDHLLEQLADEGNGNYAYIDRLSEARKVLSEELSATLMTIASDVKIQLEFNPATVSEYRLIGYENRILNEEDFNNDRVDAGEIGAGHRVTALYEISLADSGYQRLPDRRYGNHAGDPARRRPEPGLAGELAHLRIRYKRPGEDSSRLIESPIMRKSIIPEIAGTSADFRFAASVAAFGQRLRGGQYLESWDYDDIAGLARQSRGDDPFGYRSEFLQLVALAGNLDRSPAVAQD